MTLLDSQAASIQMGFCLDTDRQKKGRWRDPDLHAEEL